MQLDSKDEHQLAAGQADMMSFKCCATGGLQGAKSALHAVNFRATAETP